MEELFNIDGTATQRFNTTGYTEPTVCPQCNSKSVLFWSIINVDDYEQYSYKNYDDAYAIACECVGCRQFSLYFKSEKKKIEELVYPNKLPDIPKANEDMPDIIRELYNEASEVLSISPRASAALSRLAIDQLTEELNAKGNSLNDRISYLVKQGLPLKIQQALDVVRVIGNNAVHPGEIKFDKEDNQTSKTLLQLINFIVDYFISQPKQINEVYATLPESSRIAIEKRNRNN